MKNEYKITKQLVMSWAREYHLQGAANIVLFVLWVLVGMMGLTLVALYLTIGTRDWVDWYIAGLLLFLSIFKLFFSRFIIFSNRYKMLSKTFGVTEWTRMIEFCEDEIVLTEHNAITKLRYENIKKIKEKDNTVLIFFNDNLCVRLYKDAFVNCTWADCKAYLAGKTAK